MSISCLDSVAEYRLAWCDIEQEQIIRGPISRHPGQFQRLCLTTVFKRLYRHPSPFLSTLGATQPKTAYTQIKCMG